MDVLSALKRLVPSLALFALGFYLGYKFLDQSISGGIICGWCFGGFVWGWFLVRKWLPPQPRVVKNDGGMMDSSHVFEVVGFTLRIMASVAVGLIAMPVTLIQFIISLIMAKRERDKAIARKGGGEQEM
jgi:hypothetical protein